MNGTPDWDDGSVRLARENERRPGCRSWSANFAQRKRSRLMELMVRVLLCCVSHWVFDVSLRCKIQL